MEANLVNSTTEEKINSIELANIYCDKVFILSYALCDNLFDSAAQLRELQLTEKENDLLKEAEKCYATLVVKFKEFKNELASFQNCIMQLADSVDPNHNIDF